MNRYLTIFLFAGLLAMMVTLAGEMDFHPPSLIAATDAAFPQNVIVSGIVSTVLEVDRAGKVSSVQIVNSLAGLDDKAMQAALQWALIPAQKSGKSIASRYSISFCFDHVFSANPFSPVQKSDAAAAGDYVPPLPLMFARGNYPISSVGRGTVVVLVMVDEKGKVADAKLLKSVTGLDEISLQAARKWWFQPARLQGQPIRAEAAIAFIYEPVLVSIAG